MTSREVVYDAIDGERSYQDSYVEDSGFVEVAPLASEILLIEQYAKQAREGWLREADPGETPMNCMRIIAAIAVRCLENHGCTER